MHAPKILAFIILASLLTSLLVAGGADAETMSLTETRTINFDEYSIIMLYQTTDSSSVSYSFNVEIGTSVDFLVMTNDDFQAYIVDEPFSYLPGSTLNSLSSSASEYTPGQGVLIYVVIDNTNAPAGGAAPTGSAKVSFSVTATNVEFPSFITDIILIIAVGGVVFVVILLVILYLIFFRKKPATPLNQPGMKMCPSCGTSVPYDFQFCPKCGRRW
jgi:hypothetical protein